MIFTTTETVQGEVIKEYLGVFHAYSHDCDVFEANNDLIEHVIHKCGHVDAIVGVRYTQVTFDESNSEEKTLLAYGTAVRFKK